MPVTVLGKSHAPMESSSRTHRCVRRARNPTQAFRGRGKCELIIGGVICGGDAHVQRPRREEKGVTSGLGTEL